MNVHELTIKAQWSDPDMAWAAALTRDGADYDLNGALVGMAGDLPGAVEELHGLARHLVIEGGNYLCKHLPLPDRLWLADAIDPRNQDTGMRVALNAAVNATLHGLDPGEGNR